MVLSVCLVNQRMVDPVAQPYDPVEARMHDLPTP